MTIQNKHKYSNWRTDLGGAITITLFFLFLLCVVAGPFTQPEQQIETVQSVSIEYE